MSKIGYLLAAILILGLGTYALWPAPTQVGVKLLTSPPPAAWTSTVDGVTQRVTQERVTLTVGGKSYEFPPDQEKAGRLWGALTGIEVPAAKAILGIGPDQLPGYGVDGRREAAAEDGSAIVRWGGSGGQAYVWNGITRTLLAVDPGALAALDGAAAPVARTTVLATPVQPRQLTIDNLALVNDGGWHAVLYRNRPPFDARVQALLGQLARTAIDDLAGTPVFGLQVIGTVQIPALDGLPGGSAAPFAAGPQPARTITVYDAPPGGAVAVSGYPAQRIDPGRANELRAAFAAFKRDVLVDLYSRINRDDVLRVELTRDGQPWWSLHRRDKPPAVGGFYWDMVWAGGRESAPDDVVDRLERLLSSAAVREPVADTAALGDLPAGAVLVAIHPDRPDAQVVRVAVGGGELRSATHRARLDDGGALERALQPDLFLDDRLTRRDPSRVAKIQRRFRGASQPRDEVVVRSEGGTWARSWPAAAGGGGPVPVDGAAVDRLVRVLAAARMHAVGIVSLDAKAGEARALLDAPEFEMDVRFAAVAGGQASNDETDLDLSAAQDWGIALRRDGDRWLGVDKDLGLRFALDADTVEEFRRPFDPGQVFPVVASAVTSVAIARGDGTSVALARDGQQWTVDGQPADPVAVRRWFRALGGLQVPDGTTLDARAPEPTPGEIASTISCTVPSVSGDPFQTSEILTLAALKPGAQGQSVHVWSNRGGSRFPRGRTVLAPAAVAELFADAAAFRK